jgi:hypothetical protein
MNTTLPPFEMKPADAGNAALLAVATRLGLDHETGEKQREKAEPDNTVAFNHAKANAMQGRSLTGRFALDAVLLEEFGTADYALTQLTAVQCPLDDASGTQIILTLCPHVVKACYNTLFDLKSAASTLEWLLFPDQRGTLCYNHKNPQSQGSALLCDQYLPDLLDRVDNDYREVGASIPDAAAPLFEALGQLLGTMRRGERAKPPTWNVFADQALLAKDRNGYLTTLQIPGLPLGEIHAAPDASCCPNRYTLVLRHQEAQDAEAITAGGNYEKP